MIPVIHASDIHYSKTTQEPVLASLKTLYEYGKAKAVKLWVLSGDLFDKAIYNTASSGFPELLGMIQDMLHVAPVVTVYGTPVHDLKGCYDIFTRISAPFNFTVIEPGKSYFLDGQVKTECSETARLLILGCLNLARNGF